MLSTTVTLRYIQESIFHKVAVPGICCLQVPVPKQNCGNKTVIDFFTDRFLIRVLPIRIRPKI